MWVGIYTILNVRKTFPKAVDESGKLLFPVIL